MSGEPIKTNLTDVAALTPERTAEAVRELAGIEPGPAPPEPKLPPGRCSACRALIPREEIERPDEKGPAWHRVKTAKHDLVGNRCGPVMTEFFYQVVVTARYFVPLPVEMEHPSAIGNVEQLVRSGMRPSSATVTGWNLVGEQ